MEDYNGRKWKMEKDDFDTHTTDKKKKRSHRVEFLENVFDVAQKPDEVWLGQEYKDRDKRTDDYYLSNYILIKHYKDVSIAVVGKIENDEFVWKTWYPIKDKNKRRGLLIKKKV